MQVDALLGLNWNNHIPDPQGRQNGKDLENLQRIILKKDELDPRQIDLLKGKCKNYIEHLQNGYEYVKALRICGALLNLKNESISFSDDEEHVQGYILTALEKDYPGLSIKANLKKITSDEFNNLIEYLYPNQLSSQVDKEKATKSMQTLGILPEEEIGVDSLTTSEIILMLKSSDSLKPKLHVALLNKAIQIINGLNPNDRKDFITVVEFSKVISIDSLAGKNADDVTDVDRSLFDLNTQIKHKIIPNQSNDAQELNLFKMLVVTIFNFLNISIPHWIEVDRKFLYDVLKEVPGLYLNIPENPPDAYWEWISQLKNLEGIKLPKSTTLDQFKKLPPSFKALDISHCNNLNSNILPFLQSIKIERLFLTTPSENNVKTIKDNFTKEQFNQLKEHVKFVYDGTT